MSPLRFLSFTMAVLLIAPAGFCSPSKTKSDDAASTWLSGLDRAHPRLFLKDADLKRLKEQAKTDAVLQKYVDQVIKEADKEIGKPPLEHKLIGPRMLSVSRACLSRVQALALAYRWTGDKKYAKAAEKDLLTVCDFKDWNPSHFLDTAEMSNAVGLGYDWLYGYLSPESRAKIKAGLIRNGLKPGIEAYTEKLWFTRSDFNWNQVCNGGLSVGALAIADTDPKYADFIIPHAVASLPLALRSYGPDGVWMEGPGYWNYATRYTAYAINAYQTALGTDFGLTKIPGLSVTGRFPTYCTGPFGWYLNFADSHGKSKRRPAACMFWLAREYHDSFVSDMENKVIAEYPGQVKPFHVVWYVAPTGKPPAAPELDRVFRGKVPIAVFRSAWNDPDALWVGVKGGYNQVNHGHLDLGNFEMDALGVRWARDLGSDNYNLPGYWNNTKGGQRWTYYRMRSVSHNVPILGGRDQNEEGVATFFESQTEGRSPYVIVDLTSAYKDYAKRSMRGVRLVSNRRAVLVEDEFEIEKPCSVMWGITTDADILVKPDRTADLTLDGKKLIVRILYPSLAKFTMTSAEQRPPENPNKGVKRLQVVVPHVMGRVRIAIELSPVWKGGAAPALDKVYPLAQWSLRQQ